jgi:hypothetical protein
MPPPLSHSRGDGRIEPLSRWPIPRTFESKKACDAERGDLSKLDLSASSYRSLPPEEVYDVQCVASDDSRLKNKPCQTKLNREPSS